MGKPWVLSRYPTVAAIPQGMFGDGGSDDAPVIQAAIDTVAASGGGVVLLPPGVIGVARPILMKAKVTLQGAGSRATIIKQLATNAAWAAFTNSTGIITTDPVAAYEGVFVRDLAVVGLNAVPIPNGAGPFAKNGISLANCWRSAVQDCLVQDTGTGLILYGAVAGVAEPHNLMERCTVINARSWNAAGNPGAPRGITMDSARSTLRDCHADNCYTGFYVSTDYGVYENCRATGFTDDGFYINSNNCVFDGCRAADAPGSGFAVNPSTGHKFIGCRSKATTNAGIRLRHTADLAPSDILIDGFTAEGCGYGFLDDLTGANPGPTAAMATDITIVNSVAKLCNLNGFKLAQQRRWKLIGNTALNNNQTGVTLPTRGGIALSAYCFDGEAAGNTCVDTQGVPTQIYGFYNYLTADSGATVENSNNRIAHKSLSGIDQYFSNGQSMTVSVSIASGQRVGSAILVYPQRHEGVPKLVGAVQNGGAFADAERPAAVTFTSIGSQQSSVIVDSHAVTAAARTLTVAVNSAFP